MVIELRSPQPLMPLRIFVNRNRSGADAVRLAIGATLLGMLFVIKGRPQQTEVAGVPEAA
jgi:hypothetical protein